MGGGAMIDESLRNIIKATAEDCAARFAYYDRKEDEDLSREDLQRAIESGVVTLDEIAGWFRAGLGETDDDEPDEMTVEGVPR
jgi:hypothetical protein